MCGGEVKGDEAGQKEDSMRRRGATSAVQR